MTKKNVMRMIAMVLVLTLISTTAICGTFAKYVTSDDAHDTARVAKFGVIATVNGNLFGDSYADVNNGNKIQAAGDSHAITVTASNTGTTAMGDKLVAPGTVGGTMAFGVKGTPEVSTKIEFGKSRNATGSAADEMILADVVLKAGTYGVMVPFTGTVTTDNVSQYWKTNATGFEKAAAGDVAGTLYELVDIVTIASDYYPITWTYTVSTNANPQTARGAAALTGINTAFTTLFGGSSSEAIVPNTKLDRNASLTWAWPFTQDEMSLYKANQDTILGDLIAKAAADANITSAAATGNEAYAESANFTVVKLASEDATSATTILFKEVGTSNKVICAYTTTVPTAATANVLQTADVAVLTAAFDASITVTQVD